MIHKITLLAAAITMATPGASAASEAPAFREYFSDSTLRLDYQFGGDAKTQHVMLSRQSKSAGWAGRHSRLTELPLTGNGTVTLTDAATGDTIYRTSFSSLFHEWLSTDEAQTTQRAMENTFLVPLPRAYRTS